MQYYQYDIEQLRQVAEPIRLDFIYLTEEVLKKDMKSANKQLQDTLMNYFLENQVGTLLKGPMNMSSKRGVRTQIEKELPQGGTKYINLLFLFEQKLKFYKCEEQYMLLLTELIFSPNVHTTKLHDQWKALVRKRILAVILLVHWFENNYDKKFTDFFALWDYIFPNNQLPQRKGKNSVKQKQSKKQETSNTSEINDEEIKHTESSSLNNEDNSDEQNQNQQFNNDEGSIENNTSISPTLNSYVIYNNKNNKNYKNNKNKQMTDQQNSNTFDNIMEGSDESNSQSSSHNNNDEYIQQQFLKLQLSDEIEENSASNNTQSFYYQQFENKIKKFSSHKQIETEFLDQQTNQSSLNNPQKSQLQQYEQNNQLLQQQQQEKLENTKSINNQQNFLMGEQQQPQQQQQQQEQISQQNQSYQTLQNNPNNLQQQNTSFPPQQFYQQQQQSQQFYNIQLSQQQDQSPFSKLQDLQPSPSVLFRSPYQILQNNQDGLRRCSLQSIQSLMSIEDNLNTNANIINIDGTPIQRNFYFPKRTSFIMSNISLENTPINQEIKKNFYNLDFENIQDDYNQDINNNYNNNMNQMIQNQQINNSDKISNILNEQDMSPWKIENRIKQFNNNNKNNYFNQLTEELQQNNNFKFQQSQQPIQQNFQ